MSAKGGEATARAWQSDGFTPEEVPALESLEDAKAALDAIRRAVLTRKITHSEANAASKAVSEWVRAETAANSKELVNELHRELESKKREIDTLRKQMVGGKKLRAVR